MKLVQSLRGEDSLPTRLPPARVLSPPACRRPCCIVLAAGFAHSCGRLVLPSFAACGTGRPSSLTIRRLQSSSARAPPTAPLTSDAPTRCMHCSASSEPGRHTHHPGDQGRGSTSRRRAGGGASRTSEQTELAASMTERPVSQRKRHGMLI